MRIDDLALLEDFVIKEGEICEPESVSTRKEHPERELLLESPPVSVLIVLHLLRENELGSVEITEENHYQ